MLITAMYAAETLAAFHRQRVGSTAGEARAYHEGLPEYFFYLWILPGMVRLLAVCWDFLWFPGFVAFAGDLAMANEGEFPSKGLMRGRC